MNIVPVKITQETGVLRILLLEDSELDMKLIEGELGNSGIPYLLQHVVDEESFKASMNSFSPDLILSDFCLPSYDGFLALDEVRGRDLEVPFIFVSGAIGEDLAIEALRRGATDCVNKSHLGRLTSAVRRAVDETQERHKRIKAEEEIKNGYERLQKILFESIYAMSTALEFRDPYTAGHQKRVAELASAMSSILGLSEERTDGIYLAGMVHDIGKIYVPAEILTRPGKLSDAEFMMMKEHPETGYKILKDVDYPWPIAQSVYQHHERMDGSGYPRQLSGDDIIMEARIIAVADVVEAMASHRPYRPALGVEAALAEINEGAGKIYDMKVARSCLSLFKGGFTFS